MQETPGRVRTGGYTAPRCGRFAIADPSQQQLRVGFIELVQTCLRATGPSWRVAPSPAAPVGVGDPEARRLRPMTWGFRPA